MKCVFLFLFLAVSVVHADDGRLVGWRLMVQRYHMGNGQADEFRRIYKLQTGDRVYEFVTADKDFQIGDQIHFTVDGDDLKIERAGKKTKSFQIWSVREIGKK